MRTEKEWKRRGAIHLDGELTEVFRLRGDVISWVLTMLDVRCFSDIQVEVCRRQLQKWVWSLESKGEGWC